MSVYHERSAHCERDPLLDAEDIEVAAWATPERTPVETPRERIARERAAEHTADFSCVLYTEQFCGVATATGEALGFNVLTKTTLPWGDRFSFGLAPWARLHAEAYLQEHAPEFNHHSGSITWTNAFTKAARHSNSAVLVLHVPLRRYHELEDAAGSTEYKLVNVEIPVTIHILKVRSSIAQATDDSLHNLLHSNTEVSRDVKTRMFQSAPRGKILLYTPQPDGPVVYSRYTAGSVSVGRFRHANRSSLP